MTGICRNWEFTPEWTGEFLSGSGIFTKVDIPHNVGDIPLHYALPEHYAGIVGYRRRIDISESQKGKRIFLQFDGAAHISTLFVNGKEICTHRCGYTGFRAEITEQVRFGGTNLVALQLDTTENPEVPPFGFAIDYLTYGGMYREAWLDIRNQDYIEDVFVRTPSLDRAKVTVTADGAWQEIRLRVQDQQGNVCGSAVIGAGEDTAEIECPGAHPWNTESPQRYLLTAELVAEDGAVTDVQTVKFGFRTAEFRTDGFYLNGEKTFLRGLNRHQSYPYLGYAASERLQREDARILKNELGCNAVRTSHYPQSHYFIDECDRLGLLVFTEIPGWQHIGDEAWKEQACVNTRDMVRQYRNHPSIVLWGVRINESVDDDGLYTRTNAIAHEEDDSRQTSGVRYIEKSSLLEDVYAFNDFSHDGTTPGIKAKKTVTPDMDKPFLISECNGHMFPTKPYDTWQKRQEHALRHARVQDAALASGEHAGCFGWCMFDYQTHQDFGSGDRICYHGVTDMFRNPKLAAAVYKSQSDREPVLEVGSSMDIGDYAAGHLDRFYVFTNADEVRLYKNDQFVKSFRPKEWKALKHGPILVDDTIGELLETIEGYKGSKKRILHRCLVSAADHGLANMPLFDKLLLGWCMVRYRMSFEDGVKLYGKYVGGWGDKATVWRFDGIKDGSVCVSAVKTPGSRLHLDVTVSSAELEEGDAYDMSGIRVRILDDNNNTAVYAQLPVQFEITGAASLVGDSAVTAEGGMCGNYIRTNGERGKARLTVSCTGMEPVTVEFTVK